MSDALVTLVHDVGKYVARIARNLPPAGPVPPALAPLLVKDLYETWRGQPARARFEMLADALTPELRADLSAHFVELTALEPDVRRHEDAALRRAATIALAIERRLREALPR